MSSSRKTTKKNTEEKASHASASPQRSNEGSDEEQTNVITKDFLESLLHRVNMDVQAKIDGFQS